MSVAETCTEFKRIVYPLFKKYSKFVLEIKSHGREYDDEPSTVSTINRINRVLRHTGLNVTSLEINCTDKYPCNRLFDRIECGKLKQLTIIKLKRECQNVLSTHRFDSLELLTSTDCDLANLKHLNKLKCLNVCHSNSEGDNLQTILANNPNIGSFTFQQSEIDELDYHFDCQLLQQIPKVQKLALCCRRNTILNLNVLSSLQCLATLRIDQSVEIINVLAQFANKSLLKELEVHVVNFDGSFVNVLKDFDELELLHVDHDHNKFHPYPLDVWPIVWPPNIKQLYLNNMGVRRDVAMSTIRQLKFLEKFDSCFEFGTGNADLVFKNVSKLVANREQKLYLTLPWCKNYTFEGKSYEVSF